MKINLLFVFLFNLQFSIAQTKHDTAVTVTVGLGIERVKERQARISAFADRINNYVGGTLPDFLFEECFDTQRDLWEGFHTPVSLRWKVLQNVHNKQALKKILDVGDKRLGRKCKYAEGKKPEIIIPMIEKSFCELIRLRYRQL